MNKQTVLFFFLAIILGAATTYLLLSNNTAQISSQPSKKATLPVSRFSFENAPANSLVGSIASLSGEVKWQSRISTEAGTLTPLIHIQQGESLQTGRNGNLILVFQQTCTITLAPNSQLNIIQTLPPNLLFEQTKGVVEYSAQCQLPLSVRTSDLLLLKPTGLMKVTINPHNSLITVVNDIGSASAGFNDSTSTTRLVPISEKTTVTFNDDTRKLITNPVLR